MAARRLHENYTHTTPHGPHHATNTHAHKLNNNAAHAHGVGVRAAARAATRNTARRAARVELEARKMAKSHAATLAATNAATGR